MPTASFEFTTLTFRGPRFDDHGLDIEVLPELIAYKKLLVAMAKELWRQHHPERKRGPKGFKDPVVLKFYGIESNCTTVRLKRVVEYTDGELPMPPEDEIEEAAEMIDLGVDAAYRGHSLPASYPRDVLPYFDDLGKTLSEGHSIEMKSCRSSSPARYTPKVRDRLMSWIERVYEDNVDLKGEVRAADLDGCNFMLRLEDGTKIKGRFSPDQEATVTDALREHDTRRLRVQGTAELSHANGRIRHIKNVSTVSLTPLTEEPYDPSVRPIWERIAEIGSTIPEDALQKMPTDASINLDHYLYGTPKSEK